MSEVTTPAHDSTSRFQFRSCLTADAIIDYTGVGGERRGVEGTVEYLSKVLQPFVGFQHFILNHEVEIGGNIDRGSEVSLRVYDVTGRLVRTLAARELPAGTHTLSWGKTTWTRLGRPDRDDVQREFDPASGQHTLIHRFSLP